MCSNSFCNAGMGSGKELSSCVKEVYGMDIDVLSWDFGKAINGVISMTDIS